MALGKRESVVTYIDTHFHLEPADDLPALLARAAAAEVAQLILAGGPVGQLPTLLARIAPYPQVFAAIGVHPHEAAQFADAELPAYRELATTWPRACAIGEIGLDYHYAFSPPQRQREVLGAFLDLAKAAGLPAILHCREAEEDTHALLRERLGGRHPFVVHCFTGTPAWAERFLALGGHLSYTGILTFPKAENVRASLRVTPLDRLMFETDSPYLAPLPHRGRRNEPAFVPLVVARAAQELGLSPEELAARSTAIARQFFQLPAPG